MSEAQQPTKKVLVENNTERVLHYCETSTTKATVEGRDVEIPFHKAHALIPGCNVVDDDKWLKAFSESPLFRYHKKLGKVRILQLGKPGLLGFESDDAVAHANNTFKLGLLEEWLSVETRSDVKDALKQQITFVKGELEAPEQEDRILFKTPPKADANHMRI